MSTLRYILTLSAITPMKIGRKDEQGEQDDKKEKNQ